jgi:hypothetical protein
MKYIKTFESHKNSVNEEFLGALGNLFSNLFKKYKERISKTQGGKEIEAIYQKYLKIINGEFAKSANVQLNMIAAESGKTNENVMINEADGEDDAPIDNDVKLDKNVLKDKKTLLDNIIKKYKEIALREMDNILKKFGGASKNPQLDIIINSKKDQFDLDFMNAQIEYMNKAGDKVQVNNMVKQRDVLIKKIDADYKDFDSRKPVEYKVGDYVIYKKDGFDQVKYDALTKEQKDKPEEDPTKEYVGVHKIEKIEGDKVTMKTDDGKEFTKLLSTEIIGKTNGFKVGDGVIYQKNAFDQAKYDALTQDQKDKPNEAPASTFVGSHTVEKVEGDIIHMKDNKGGDFTKTTSQIIGKVNK